jgi:class 3 adenylate cyclase
MPPVGQVSEDPSQVVEQFARTSLAFDPSGDEVTLVVHVANRRYRTSGFGSSIALGTATAIEGRHQREVLLDAATATALTTMGLGFLVLFVRRRREPTQLWFALFCLVLAFRTVLGGPGEIDELLLPPFPVSLALNLEYATLPTGGAMALLFFVHLTGIGARSPMLLIGTGGLAVLAVVSLLTPMRWLGPVLVADQLATLLVAALSLTLLGIATYRRLPDAQPLLLATGLYTIAFVHDIGVAADLLVSPYELGTVGFLAMLLVQGGILIRSFARSVTLNERLTEDLKRTHESVLRFVPFAFLDLLGRKNIVEIQRGDHTRQELHILFCDLRSFTPLIESLGPDRAFPFINRYLRFMEPSITRNHGFISQYLGDAIMALFPTPADAAVRAALEMCDALARFNAEEPEGQVAFGIGIGSGPLMLGTIGGEERLDGGVIGDSVNQAARIEGMTKIYGTVLLIDESTWSRLEAPEALQLRELDLVRSKGRSKPTRIFEVLDALPESVRQARLSTLDRFTAALSDYRAGAFAAAREGFAAIVAETPDDATAALYLERCDALIASPPRDWEGITNLTRKA